MSSSEYPSRVFILPKHVIERLETSARDKGRGGWQNLCAEIIACRAPKGLTGIISEIRQQALQDAVEALRAYKAAEEDEG